MRSVSEAVAKDSIYFNDVKKIVDLQYEIDVTLNFKA